MIEKEQDKNRHTFAIVQKYCSETPLSVVKASGEDALEFLQGQFTQDLSSLSDNATAYGFLLTQKGRVIGDAFLRRIDAEAWQLISWSLGPEDLIARLDAYIIADDVELADETGAWKAWRVGGSDGAPESLPALPPGAVMLDYAPGLSLPWRVWVVPASTAMVWPEGWASAPLEIFEAVRIAAGWPRVPVDLGPSDFPPEGGRHHQGVSYTKGCYLGQEVMARLAATGRLRRGLARVHGSADLPAGAVELVQADKTVGELRSWAGTGEEGAWIGLAMMQLARFDEAAPLATAAGGPVGFDGMVGG